MKEGFNLEYMTLDIGCGYRPNGTINIDKSLYPYEAEGDKSKKAPVDLLAIGEYLPFRDNTFLYVHSSQVIEHCYNPKRFIEESLRVCIKEVIIKCPHNKGVASKMKYHHFYFNEDWFNKQWKISYVNISKEPFLPFWIIKSHRIIRWIVRRYFPIKRLDRLMVVIEKNG